MVAAPFRVRNVAQAKACGYLLFTIIEIPKQELSAATYIPGISPPIKLRGGEIFAKFGYRHANSYFFHRPEV